MGSSSAIPTTKHRYFLDVLVTALGLILTVASALFIGIHFKSDRSPATEADIGLVCALIAAAAGMLLLILLEVLKARWRLIQAERRLHATIQLDHAIGTNPLIRSTVRRLCETKVGVEEVRLEHLCKVITGHFRECSIPLTDEYQRLDILTQVVKASSTYVSAYTYADPHYLKDFWIHPHDEIRLYYKAHREKLEHGFRQLYRVFVVPDSLLNGTNHNDRVLLRQIVDDHRAHGMSLKERVHFVRESDARAEFNERRQRFPEHSFFVSDDVFFSARGHASDSRNGSVNFYEEADEECKALSRTFSILLSAAREKSLSATELFMNHAARPVSGGDRPLNN